MNGSATPSGLDPDKSAAHEFLAELRTRITTQALPYQYGVETRALESLWDVFDHARTAMKKYPGCTQFAAAVTRMLNEDLRPVTAKWHRALTEGRLNSRDGGDEFRADLKDIQGKLKVFAEQLQMLAYGRTEPDAPPPPVMSEAELDKCLGDLAFGIAKQPSIPDATVDAINSAEAEEVEKRREYYGSAAKEGRNAVGLALSGGGIRSATFCLGVAQVLSARNLLEHVDFLSTVSGGGYTGSFITARLGDGDPYQGIAGPYGPDPGPIRYLRYHAKFLTAINLKQSWSMVTATLAGMILNWTAPLLLVALAAMAAKGFVHAEPDPKWWPVALALSGCLTIIALVLYGGFMRARPEVAEVSGQTLGWLIAATGAIGAGWLIVIGHARLPDWIASHWVIPGSIGSLAVAGPAIVRFVPVLQNPKVRKIALQVLLWTAGVVVPLGALAVFYGFWWLADLGTSADAGQLHPLHYVNGTVILAVLIVAMAVVAFGLLNINLTGPHRLYRDQLAATFIQKNPGEATTISLTKINPQSSAPYHLINTALNLPSSESPALRDRKCDFFLFSKHWCGAPITGYHRTVEWKTNGAPADLATAMAVSGAAASSYMGLGSMHSLTALLTFLNVRLASGFAGPTSRDG